MCGCTPSGTSVLAKDSAGMRTPSRASSGAPRRSVVVGGLTLDSRHKRTLLPYGMGHSQHRSIDRDVGGRLISHMGHGRRKRRGAFGQKGNHERQYSGERSRAACCRARVGAGLGVIPSSGRIPRAPAESIRGRSPSPAAAVGGQPSLTCRSPRCSLSPVDISRQTGRSDALPIQTLSRAQRRQRSQGRPERRP
jgi:hypothetical protein